jgi:hypothetical protein
MTPVLCGQPIDALVGGPSPFDKIIALGYDDGPSAGLALCQGGVESYWFEQVAVDVDGRIDHERWDRGEELRVFTLAPYPVRRFDGLVARLTAIESPSWPIWWPGARSPDPALDRAFAEELGSYRAEPRPVLVIAIAGLLEPIVAIRSLPGDLRLPPPDWFALLELSAGAPAIAMR